MPSESAKLSNANGKWKDYLLGIFGILIVSAATLLVSLSSRVAANEARGVAINQRLDRIERLLEKIDDRFDAIPTK